MTTIISSVPEEGKEITREFKNPRVSVSSHLRPLHGKIHGRDVVYVASGIGKTNASHATTVLIEKYSPDIIILLGVGGAYPQSGLRVGDIAVAEKEVYGDEGVLAKDGFHGAEFIGIPFLKRGNKKYFNVFPFNKRLIKMAFKSFQPATCNFQPATNVKSGPFVTVSTCTGTRKRALELENRFNAVCENMEGAAVAHICAIYGVPLIEIRGISNIVGDRDKNRWDIRLAAENCQKAVMEMFKEISYFL